MRHVARFLPLCDRGIAASVDNDNPVVLNPASFTSSSPRLHKWVRCPRYAALDPRLLKFEFRPGFFLHSYPL